MIHLPLDDRQKINLAKPVYTIDVNLVSLRHPTKRPQEYKYLASMEFNYFETESVEIAVTPETTLEISQGTPDHNLGWTAYRRITKSRWFKDRPTGSTIHLNSQESNELWLEMRYKLWPSASDILLTNNQRSDVNQIFFHAVTTGSTVSNSVFVTQDNNFIKKTSEFRNSYGISITTPTQAWLLFEKNYNLSTPSSLDIDNMWRNQNRLLDLIQSKVK